MSQGITAAQSSEPLLQVEELCTEFRTARGALRAVDRVSFTVGRGETVGLVGESGCGKSTVALSILRLVPDPPGRIVAGRVLFAGSDLLRIGDAALRAIRGGQIGMVFQEPISALNPVLSVGEQVTEVLREHRQLRGRNARERAIALLHEVGLPDPAQCYRAYPHQLSGGMRQRVMIAIALGGEPRLLLADEPTAALDVTLQAQIVELLATIQRRRAMSMVLITHDLALVAETCQAMVVLYGGQVVERGPVAQCFAAPAHPYTAALLELARALHATQGAWHELAGGLPDLVAPPGECRFAPRCCAAGARCLQQAPELQPLVEGEAGHLVRCWHPVGR